MIKPLKLFYGALSLLVYISNIDKNIHKYFNVFSICQNKLNFIKGKERWTRNRRKHKEKKEGYAR